MSLISRILNLSAWLFWYFSEFKYFFGKHIESKDHNSNHIWKKITENTGKKRKKGALKSRISSLSIVTYPQGITVLILKKITEEKRKLLLTI